MVVDWPLAQMDFATLSQSHVHPCDLWRGAFEERGQTVTIENAPGQRWWYLGGHRTDEVTMLKIWDSWGPRGVADGESLREDRFAHAIPFTSYSPATASTFPSPTPSS
jgi:hypothetical protein